MADSAKPRRLKDAWPRLGERPHRCELDNRFPILVVIVPATLWEQIALSLNRMFADIGCSTFDI
jgi:hypothetical protein